MLVKTPIVTVFLSKSGVIFSLLIYVLGRYSSHTLCHIPLCGVYHIPPCFVACFPLLIGAVSLGSTTHTVSSLSPSLRKDCISQVKGVYPPICSHQGAVYSRKHAFRGERHEYFAVECSVCRRFYRKVAFLYLVIPFSVEGKIAVSYHLRTGICRSIRLVRPYGFQVCHSSLRNNYTIRRRVFQYVVKKHGFFVKKIRSRVLKTNIK